MREAKPPIRTGNELPQVSGEHRVRLLTLNVLFRDDVRPRLRVLSEILDEARYDVVCLQELMYRRNLRLVRRRAPSYPYQSATGFGVLKGGLAILSRTPVSCRFATYPIQRPVRPELLMRKGIQCAAIRLGDARLAIFNTHLSANRADSWATENPYVGLQRKELARLARAVSAVGEDVPVVVLGDLNVPGTNRLFTEFAAATGLRDVLAGDHRPTYRPTEEFPAPPDLDHVLVRSSRTWLATATARRVFADPVELADGRTTYLSDHYGLEVELLLTRVDDGE